MNSYTANYGPLISHYVQRFKQTIDNALKEYPRVFALRVDLRLPDNEDQSDNEDSTLITRFITSMKAQIRADLYRKKQAGKRTYPCRVRYIWVREFNMEEKKHYHVLLLLNKDAYAYPGNYRQLGSDVNMGGFISMVNKAWLRTLKRSDKKYHTLTYVPKNAFYHLNRKNGETHHEYLDLIGRVNYMAKERSKSNADGQRCFGCSQS